MKNGFMFALLAFFTQVAVAEIQVTEAWAKESIPGTNTSALFATLYNTTRKPTELVKVVVEGVDKAELHTHNEQDGMMQMRRVDAIDIGARATVALAPGGFHVMLFQLKAPLKAGTDLAVEFHFSNGEQVAAVAKVVNPHQAGEHQHHH
ncbi:copper chaperone PCu(A)C [Simiduia curdlanivorans]|uniref:Copper chaperone PCu(A)C n=1 Tax=Simiduia curdlanivorans TaxID=1492769 RepID=A0ABV8V344_9GAMM|nr:copper chaperone PCu(A)C [Simiduia curdlanivorans]MDN3638366.1 copper chaperone PCu(A)C [Simiduia curdlanivorans]